MTRHPDRWSHPRPVPEYVGTAWPISQQLPQSPGHYSNSLYQTPPRSSRSETSSGDRPRKTRRLCYQGYEESPIYHRSHDPRSSRDAHLINSTPIMLALESKGTSSHVRASPDRRQRPRPSVEASPRRTVMTRHPPNRAIITQAGSWCENSPERYQMLPDECLFDDDALEADPAWDAPPRCPSPPSYRLATPDLAPMCTDSEFCTCCNHEPIGWVGWHKPRREKLEAQGKSGTHALVVSWLIPHSSRCDELYCRH